MKTKILSLLILFLSTFCYAQKTDYMKELNSAYNQLNDNPQSIHVAAEVQRKLIQMEKGILSSNIKDVSDVYYQILVYTNSILGDYPKVHSYYGKIKNPDEQSTYLEALAYVKSKNYNSAENLLTQYLFKNNSREFSETDTNLLYASVLARQKKYKNAVDIYSKLEGQKKLQSDSRIEYAKVLFLQGEYSQAQKISDLAKNPLSDYLSGLCCVNEAQWKKAGEYLNNYIQKQQKSAPYYEEARYYNAYALYKAGEYKKAYNLISVYAEETTQLDLGRKAHELAAKSAVLCGDFNSAATQAEKLIQVCFNEEEKQEAIIFCAEIYSDSGNYQKALNTLKPYTNEKSDFALRCWSKSALLYEKLNNYVQADAIYEKIERDYSSKPEAEEACFRRGELYYSQKNYGKAAEKFAGYISKYSNGKFLENAYYFCGESYLRSGDDQRCILQTKKMLSKYPNGTFYYGGNKNLLQAYYNAGNYAEAQRIAEFLMNNYQAQALADGVQDQLSVLRKINGGTRRDIAEKRTEFENAGGYSTKQGRLIGFELFKLYNDSGMDESAATMARELNNAKDSRDKDELYYMGEINVYLRNYLKAAEYYRSSGKDNQNKAAAALYSAIDDFIQNGKIGDARETAKTLKSLYPESRQAKNVDALFNY